MLLHQINNFYRRLTYAIRDSTNNRSSYNLPWYVWLNILWSTIILIFTKMCGWHVLNLSTMHIETWDVGRSARASRIWREFVLRQIGIIKRANVTLFPPHNSRSRIKFRKSVIMPAELPKARSHCWIVRASHRNPSSCLIPVGFYMEILIQRQLNSFYATRIYMESYAGRRCRATSLANVIHVW